MDRSPVGLAPCKPLMVETELSDGDQVSQAFLAEAPPQSAAELAPIEVEEGAAPIDRWRWSAS